MEGLEFIFSSINWKGGGSGGYGGFFGKSFEFFFFKHSFIK